MIPRVPDAWSNQSRMVVARNWRGGGNEELVFSGHEVSGLEDVKVLELDGGDACTTM